MNIPQSRLFGNLGLDRGGIEPLEPIESVLPKTPFSEQNGFHAHSCEACVNDLEQMMFDQLPATAIQDRVSDALYRWRGIAEWPEAEATVSDYMWTPDAEISGEGNYQVSFSYRAGELMQAGVLGINGLEKVPPYQRGATFTLRYNPKRPWKYYYANERSSLERAMLIAGAVTFGAIAGLIMVGLSLK